MLKFFVIIFIFSICSCHQPLQQGTKAEQVDSTMPVTVNNKEHDVSGRDTVFEKKQQSLFPGGDTLSLKMNIDGFKEQPVIPVHIKGGKILCATIIAEKEKANIRINQIEMPDSTFDGPFGKNLSYTIKNAGNYKLIIGESQMAEGLYKGSFTLKAWVK